MWGTEILRVRVGSVDHCRRFDEPQYANSVEDMQASAVSSVLDDGRRVDMEEISQTIQLLSENTLSTISKGPLVKFTQECDNVE